MSEKSQKCQKMQQQKKTMLKNVNRGKNVSQRLGFHSIGATIRTRRCLPYAKFPFFYFLFGFHYVVLSHGLKEMRNRDLLSDGDDDDDNYNNSDGKVDHNAKIIFISISEALVPLSTPVVISIF